MELGTGYLNIVISQNEIQASDAWGSNIHMYESLSSYR